MFFCKYNSFVFFVIRAIKHLGTKTAGYNVSYVTFRPRFVAHFLPPFLLLFEF